MRHTLPGKGVGVQTTAEWKPEAKAVEQHKLVSKPVDLAATEDTRLASSLYSGQNLIWRERERVTFYRASRLTRPIVPVDGGVL